MASSRRNQWESFLRKKARPTMLKHGRTDPKSSVTCCSTKGSKFSVRHLKMALLSCLRTPGLRGALHYTGTRSISSGTLHIKDPQNFWCGGRVNLKDVKTKSEPVYEPATGRVLCQLQACGVADVDAAVRSVSAALTVWSKLAGTERARVMLEAARLIEKRGDC